MTLKLSIQNTLILRMSRVSNFADIIKIATMLIQKAFKDSKKVKRITNYVHIKLYLYFLIEQKLEISGETLMSAELRGCITSIQMAF